MQHMRDPDFDVIAAAIAKDARAAAFEEVAAAAAEVPAKLPQEKNNNWGIPENQSMMEIRVQGSGSLPEVS